MRANKTLKPLPPLFSDNHDYSKHVKQILRSPYAWLDSAESLLYVSQSLGRQLEKMYKENKKVNSETWKNIDLHKRDKKFIALNKTYYLLSGLALESLSKGIIVAREPEYDILNHGLKDLLIKAGIDFSDKKTGAWEKQLCERLKINIVWSGRYPAPKPKSATDIRYGMYLEPDLSLIKKWVNSLRKNLIIEVEKEMKLRRRNQA